MYSNALSSAPVGDPTLRFAGSHGYRIDGDVAYLNAELQVLDAQRATGRDWALQLWANDAADSAGPATKIAELRVAPVVDPQMQTTISGTAFAQLPAGAGERALTLVLASGADGRFDTVHDVASYARLDCFVLPRFAGKLGYRFVAGGVELTADAIDNPRSAENLSGTLALELWALDQPYSGGQFAGLAIAGGEIGSIAGQGRTADVTLSLPAAPIPAGTWHLVLMLREWTSAGYVTRDYCNFALPYVVAAPVAKVEAAAPAEVEIEAAAPVATRPPAEKPAAPASAAGDTRVSVNKASEVQLAAVKGMSKPIAKAIVSGRPFKRIDDLVSVKGVGTKLLAKLREYLTL